MNEINNEEIRTFESDRDNSQTGNGTNQYINLFITRTTDLFRNTLHVRPGHCIPSLFKFYYFTFERIKNVKKCFFLF